MPPDPRPVTAPGDPAPPRARVLAAVAGMVPARGRGRAVLVAVDGVDGAGKTTFADELAAVLRGTGRTVLRASVDDFHHPRAHRHRRGRGSPEGYWLDAYDYDRLRSELLGPLGPDGDGLVRPGVHDVRADRYLDRPRLRVPTGAVLLLDGVFLHRDELVGYWDFSIYLQVDLAVSLHRLALRDGPPVDAAGQRYVGAHRHYADTCRPRRRAGVVVDNTVFDAPRVITGAK